MLLAAIQGNYFVYKPGENREKLIAAFEKVLEPHT